MVCVTIRIIYTCRLLKQAGDALCALDLGLTAQANLFRPAASGPEHRRLLCHHIEGAT